MKEEDWININSSYLSGITWWN